jgi:GGDEF domain-containing protein
MDSAATPEDLHRSLRLLRRQPPFTIVLVQIDPGPPLDAGGPEEIEGLIERLFGDRCWRLEDGRYLGVYVGDDKVRPKAEALRQAIGDRCRRTVSLGLALPRADLGPLDLLLRAEQALLAARKAGGNRVELAARQDTSRTERDRLGPHAP